MANVIQEAAFIIGRHHFFIVQYFKYYCMLPTLRHYSFIVDVFDFTGNIVAKECLKVTLWTVAVTSLWTTEKTCYSTVQLEQKGTSMFVI